jgi:DivIVA domain-containing protein
MATQDEPQLEPVTAHDALHIPFKVRTFRTAYNQDQVDNFLDLAAVALGALDAGDPPSLSINDVCDVKFDEVRFQPGYDMLEVDDFLDCVAHTLQGADR